MRIAPVLGNRLGIGLGIGLGVAVGGAASAQTVTVDFEDLAVGAQFPKHIEFMTGGATLSGEEYIVFPNGPASFFGWIVVDDQNMAGGTGNEVRTDGAPLEVDAPLPLTGLSMKFGHFGDDFVNFNLNDEFLVIQTLDEVNGQTIAGVDVEVTFNGTPGRSSGELTLTGPIQLVQIGGLGTFWIDDLVLESACYPDCDTNGTLDIFDFLCFQNSFILGQTYANCDRNPLLNIFDFLCFQDAFLTGCP